MIKLPIDFKNTKQVTIIAIAVGAGVLYLYVNFLLLPQISGVGKSYKTAKSVRTEIKSAERDIAGIGDMKKRAVVYRSKIDSYERMLPAGQEIPKLLEDLSVMAKSSNVKIVGITPLQSKQESQSDASQIYQEIPILISARSGYHELGRFLYNLENSDRFMKVVDIDIKSNKTGQKRHEVELLVLTYVLLGNK